MADKRISQLIERVDIANNDVLPIVASGATTTNKVTVSTLQDWMQDNLDVGVTSVGITLGSSGTDVSVSGSPITSSGNITINIPTASATNRGLLSSADWTTFNSKQQAITLTTTGTSGAATLVSGTLNIPNYSTDLSGYVTLGTAQTITAQKTFTTSGSSDTMIISHGSGSGFALDVLKAGNGEAIRVTKTSGSGNAMTISGGNFEAGTIVKTGGTSSQFLKADGSVDSSTYLTTGTAASTYVPYTGATTSVNLGDNVLTSGGLNIDNLGGFGGALNLRQATGFSLWSGAPYTSIYATTGNRVVFNFSNDGRTFTLDGSIVSASTPRTFTFPDATGTLALSSDLGAYLPLTGGTLTGALNGTSATFTSGITLAGAAATSIFSSFSVGGTTYGYNGVSGSSGSVIIGSVLGDMVIRTVNKSILFSTNDGSTSALTIAAGTGAATFTGALNGTSATFTAAGSTFVSTTTTGGSDMRISSGATLGYVGTTSNHPLSFVVHNGVVANFDTNGVLNLGAALNGTSASFNDQLKLSYSSALIDAIIFEDTRPTSGSGTWRIGAGTGGVGFGIYSNTLASTPFFLAASTGAATFSSSVTATSFSNAGLYSGEVFHATKSNPSYITYLKNTSASGYGLYIQNGNDSNDALRITNAADTANNIQLFGSGKAYFAGNVGIGTASPNNIFTIYAASSAIYTQWIQSGTGTTSTDGLRIGLDASSNGIIDLNEGTALITKVEGSERMRITSGGTFKAKGSESTYHNIGATYHELRTGTGGQFTTAISNTAASPFGLLIDYNSAPNNSTSEFLYCTDGIVSTLRAAIRSNGGLSNYQANDTNLSDERTKKDIEPLESYWDKFKAIKIVKFKYKDQTHDDFNIGVIAQQVEVVAPEFVDVDGWNKPELDEEGNEIISEEEPLKSIYTADLYHATIKVLQEAMAKIEELQIQIDSLKNQIK